MVFMYLSPAIPQGILNKVKNAVSKEISGNKDNTPAKNSAKSEPEPKCACNNATVVMELGGKIKIAYNEMSIFIKDDGSVLVYDKIAGKYYISKNGVAQGPYNEDDQIVKGYHAIGESDESSGNDQSNKTAYWIEKYPSFISHSGEKYLIKFSGKTYGPYVSISDFAVPGSGDNFAAVVTENMMITEDQGKKMDEAMKNAKTDQERMELSMKFSQQAAQQMSKEGSVASMTPKLISSVPGVQNDIVKWTGMRLNSTLKYDEIVMLANDKIVSLQGKTLMTFPVGTAADGKFFISSSNDRYANYKYGTLTFNDKSTLSNLFSPILTRKEGRIYLAYMYYSPGKNAIMQCLIPF